MSDVEVDLDGLIAALQRDPAQRATLRQVLWGEQAGWEAAQRATQEALASLAERMEGLTAAQTRTEGRVDQLTAHVDELAKGLGELAQAQRTTESSLADLIAVVKGMHDRLGKLDGDACERRYRERGPAYLRALARRLRLIDFNPLGLLVDDAVQAGVLSERDADSLMQADAVFSGIGRADHEPLHLVVEASVTVDYTDVHRARERADLLARIVDTPVLAVVAGEFAPSAVVQAAQDAEVWVVTNGRAVGPTDHVEA